MRLSFLFCRLFLHQSPTLGLVYPKFTRIDKAHKFQAIMAANEITLPLVLSPTVTGYYLIALFGRNGILGRHLYAWTGWSIMYTWYAAVLASLVVALPLMVKTARAAIESVEENYIRASYTLGHSEYWTALKVILPLARKGIFAGTILSFARPRGEFGATLRDHCSICDTERNIQQSRIREVKQLVNTRERLLKSVKS